MEIPANIEINEQFAHAIELMERGDGHVFITGKAGTGKSTLLSYFRAKTARPLVVLAPTGVAAVNVAGQTIHSFFRFKPDITLDKAKRLGQRAAKKERSIYRRIDAIIMDEVSMVRADLLDCVDAFLRLARGKNDLPFGGVRLIMIGDLYQLPPVVTSREREIFSEYYPGPYFFDAHIFSEMDVHIVELTKIYRQHEKEFIDILNRVRNSSIDHELLATLNKRVVIDFKPDGDFYIHLTSLNREADVINLQKINELKGRSRRYVAEIDGSFDEKSFPTVRELKLKIGAQVMLVNNDSNGRWVNGTVAKVTAICADEIEVELPDGTAEIVEPHTWELFHFGLDKSSKQIKAEVVGKFTQIPVRLAWAITIHKAQGKTFDKAIVDLHRAFACGQAYVALSRVRSMGGLILKCPVKRGHIRVDRRIMSFLTKFQYDISEDAMPIERKIETIRKTIETGKRLAITYLKGNDEKSHRVVKPIEVGEMSYCDKAFIGVRAMCLKRRDERTFRVDRILKMDVV